MTSAESPSTDVDDLPTADSSTATMSPTSHMTLLQSAVYYIQSGGLAWYIVGAVIVAYLIYHYVQRLLSQHSSSRRAQLAEATRIARLHQQEQSKQSAQTLSAAPTPTTNVSAESRRLQRLYRPKEDASATDRSDILDGFVPAPKSGFNPIHRSLAETRSSFRGVMRPSARPAAGG